jgi:DNA repair protein RecO (recombination protein O)
MIRSEVHLQPAYILQHKKYRETSLIIDILTRDFGIVSVLAKGVRKKKSKTVGLLLAFMALKFSYTGNNELKILTHVELDSSLINLNGISLYSGFYINELILCFLHKYDPYPEVFAEYERCLILLTNSDNIEEILRFFELNLMEYVGYGIQLTTDSQTEAAVEEFKKYLYRGGTGMLESSKGYICGRNLLAMEARKSLDKQALYEAKQLMRQVIDFHLQNKELKSRAVLTQIIRNL